MRTIATVLVALALLSLFALQTWSQPAVGFGPVYDPVNQALRVNNVGAGGGGTSSNFGTAFPVAGTAIGFQDSTGAMASISATNRLPVTCDNCSSSAATFGTAFPTSGSAIGGRDALGAFASVTVTNSRLDTNATFAGVAEVHTTSDSTLTATVTQTTAANLNALVAQGASAVTANAWPLVHVSDAGVMVRAGDPDNKALRMRIVASDVASGGTSSNFGTAFPTAGTAAGFKGPLGGMASASVDNSDRLLVIVASAVTANAGTGTFTVSGTVTANAGTGTLSVRSTSDSTLTATVTQANASSLNATVVQSGIWNVRTTSDSTLTATVTQTTAANLNVRPDYSTATGTLASSRAALIAGLGASASGVNFLGCDLDASISTANAGNWRLIPGQTNKRIFVCGYTVVASGPLAIKFMRGTQGSQFNSGCNAQSTDVSGAMNISASGGIVNAVGVNPIFTIRPGDGFCINLSDGKQVGGHITYTQF